jgi:hypothetical protein
MLVSRRTHLLRAESVTPGRESEKPQREEGEEEGDDRRVGGGRVSKGGQEGEEEEVKGECVVEREGCREGSGP